MRRVCSKPTKFKSIPATNQLRIADSSKVTAKIKGELPGRGKEAEKRGEAFASQAGKTLDDTVIPPSSQMRTSLILTDTSQVAEAKAKAAEAEKAAEQYSKDGKAKFEKYSKEAKAELNATIDQFDKTVEQKTAEAKSGISSWFGFGKK